MNPNNLPDDINLVFNGTDGEEAESFISSVLRAARIEGKIRDNEWLVDLVSTCMRGQALRWYIDLDEGTQNDWKLLRKAILRQYPSQALEPPAPSLQPTIPTPAAAATPPNIIAGSSNQSTQAPDAVHRIRVYFSNTKSKFFLGTKDDDQRARLTSSDAKAFRVRWTPGSELRLIENGLETQRKIWLLWHSRASNGHSPNSTSDFATPVISDSPMNVLRIPVFSGATQQVTWTLDQEGWLRSYSSLNQTQYQHHFCTSPGDHEGRVVHASLKPLLDGLGIHDDTIFKMKFEPV